MDGVLPIVYVFVPAGIHPEAPSASIGLLSSPCVPLEHMFSVYPELILNARPSLSERRGTNALEREGRDCDS